MMTIERNELERVVGGIAGLLGGIGQAAGGVGGLLGGIGSLSSGNAQLKLAKERAAQIRQEAQFAQEDRLAGAAAPAAAPAAGQAAA